MKFVPALLTFMIAIPLARGGDYVENYQTWSGGANAIWEVKDLSGAPFNVPPNTVVEVAVMNTVANAERSAGVRAVGSALERRFALQEAEAGGRDVVVMHVQTNSLSRIEQYVENANNITFVLLGYWTCGTYVEAFDTFTAGAAAMWQDENLNAFGVSASQIAEVVMVNKLATDERQAGVRTNGSGLARLLDLHEPEDGGLDLGTMFVAADGTSNATIEVYAEIDADVDFYLVGYWSVAPGTYTEAFTDVGSPAMDGTWEDIDLTASGVPDDGVAEFALANRFATAQNNMGVRENGPSLGRLLNIHEAEDGGEDVGRMHVPADATATIEFYHQDVSEAHAFLLIGYWVPADALIFSNHTAGQETDAFTDTGGDNDAELFAFKLDSGGATITITQLVFRISDISGLMNGDWASVEIMVDDNDDGDIGGTETTQRGGPGTVNQTAGTITFSTSFDVTAATSYILRADFTDLSDGDAVTIKLNSADISTTDCKVGAAYPVPHREACAYVERLQTWSSLTAETWEVQDLRHDPFDVPPGAVVEIAFRNTSSSQRVGGVRAVGSTLARTFDVHRPFDGGSTVAVMHVQTDSNARIEHFSFNLPGTDFVLLGYWTCGTYVEAIDTFTAGADAAWTDENLNAYGVSSGEIAEIVIANNATEIAREAGVRTNGSGLARFVNIHGTAIGDVALTMLAAADGTTNATIELYAEVDLEVNFYLVGYWTTSPGTYTELFSDIGSPSADTTWEDVDLTGFGVVDNAVAEIVLANSFGTEENEMGVRENGSSLARLLDVHEAADEGSDLGRMHVKTDGTATIEFYHEDVSDAHTFRLTGYWAVPVGPLFLYWKFDDCSGPTTADASTYNHDGTIEPDEATGPQRTKRGRICGAFDFDGSNDDISGGDLTEQDGTVLTAMAWVRPQTLATLKAAVSKFNSSTETGWAMETGGGSSGGSDDVRISFSATQYAYTTGNILSANQWAHWAFVYDGDGAANTDRLKFYLNGSAQSLTFVGSIPTSLTNTTNNFMVGATSDGARYFDAIIDEVQLSKAALLASEVLTLAGEANYTITDMGTLGSPYDDPSVGFGINDNTTFMIAGYSEDATSDDERAFRYKSSTITDLGALAGGSVSFGADVNDNENICGTSDDGTDTLPFVWTSGSGMVSLGKLTGYDDGEGLGINASGDIAGTAFDEAAPSLNLRAFLWTPTVPNGTAGTYADLGSLGGSRSMAIDVNDGNTVVGGAQTSGRNSKPFSWTSGGGMVDLGTLGGQSSQRRHRANAINAAGKIVGLSYTTGDEAHGFIWVSGATDGVPSNLEMKDLGVLSSGDFSQALGINDSDEVVGRSNITAGGTVYHAFIWLNDTLIDLNDEVDINTTWVFTAAHDINNNAYITGWGTNPSSDDRAMYLTPFRTCACDGGGIASPIGARGSGSTDRFGDFGELAVDEAGNVLAEILVTDAEAAEEFEFTVSGASLPTWAGFADGIALDRMLTIETTARKGTYLLTASLVFTEEELDAAGVGPNDVEVHVLDRSRGPASGVWIPAGDNVGESVPTGVFGQSGYAYNGDGTVDFWWVGDEGGTFAVGAKNMERDRDAFPPPRVAPPVCGLGMLPAMMATCMGLLMMPRRVGPPHCARCA